MHNTTVYTTLHCTTLITPHHNYNCNCNYNYARTRTNYTTLPLQVHYPTPQLQLQLCYTRPHYIKQVWKRWPLQPLQPLQKTQLQSPYSPSVDSLCHSWLTTTKLSYYRFLFLKLPPPPCAVLLVLHKLCMYINICTYMHAYVHPCMHTYIHACIHACMHAYILSFFFFFSSLSLSLPRCYHSSNILSTIAGLHQDVANWAAGKSWLTCHGSHGGTPLGYLETYLSSNSDQPFRSGASSCRE